MMHQLTLKNLLLAAKTLATVRKVGSTHLNKPLEDVIQELLMDTLAILQSSRFRAGARDSAACGRDCLGDSCGSSLDEEEESEDEDEDEDDSSSDSNSASVMPFTMKNALKVSCSSLYNGIV